MNDKTVVNIGEAGKCAFSPDRAILAMNRISREVLLTAVRKNLRNSLAIALRAHEIVCCFNPASSMLAVIRRNIEDATNKTLTVFARHERLQVALDQVNGEMIAIVINSVKDSEEDDPLCSVDMTIMLLSFLEN